MKHTFVGVMPMPNYLLKFYLTSGGVALFDMKPYIELGDFKVLKNIDIFNSVYLDRLEGVCWDYKNLSLSKDTIIAHMY
ncbi:hypothetical protein ACNUKZ_15260 (plasmid) [Clostridium perfringens]|uniref:hypothetical protein n=1 Tax=Clostridium perfringens TaxID=1502 RepID=UPI003B00CB23